MAKNFRALSVKQARAIDARAREQFGMPTLLLMENAGRAVAEEVLKGLRNRRGRIAVFCGKGNNGGDGFTAARHLSAQGKSVDIFLAGETGEARNEAKANLDILLKSGQKVTQVSEKNLRLVKNKISHYGLIIDALLGVGITGEVRRIYRDLIGIINSSRAYILSVDIPSGLDADTGEVLGICVRADKTVTFVAPKRGMLKGSGLKYCGKIVVKDLGVPLSR
jgi:NAD(P)H-hydrate epimerase